MKLIRTNIHCVENLGLYFHVDIVDYVYLGLIIMENSKYHYKQYQIRQQEPPMG